MTLGTCISMEAAAYVNYVTVSQEATFFSSPKSSAFLSSHAQSLSSFQGYFCTNTLATSWISRPEDLVSLISAAIPDKTYQPPASGSFESYLPGLPSTYSTKTINYQLVSISQRSPTLFIKSCYCY